ncbi:hypothetical protein EYF80_017151 [Liparis tanakae]|uniref:Uncharacterized protein n=1 Tax=Liparis tanakae TaxID=230148 RepID=A0A4Z2I5G2_9TELE|nr:hypothetical protein EYF80_017151 [Liparis tanakae]
MEKGAALQGFPAEGEPAVRARAGPTSPTRSGGGDACRGREEAAGDGYDHDDHPHHHTAGEDQPHTSCSTGSGSRGRAAWRYRGSQGRTQKASKQSPD